MIDALTTKSVPLDLLYSVYAQECKDKGFNIHSPNNFQQAIQMWLRFENIDEFLIKKFDINRIEDQQGNIIHLY